MIDLTTERVVTLAGGAKLLPRRRAGRPTHLSTLIRWAKQGARADDGTIVHLEAIRIGRTLCTSAEALQRFCDRLTSAKSTHQKGPTTAVRRLADEQADRELTRRGF